MSKNWGSNQQSGGDWRSWWTKKNTSHETLQTFVSAIETNFRPVSCASSESTIAIVENFYPNNIWSKSNVIWVSSRPDPWAIVSLFSFFGEKFFMPISSYPYFYFSASIKETLKTFGQTMKTCWKCTRIGRSITSRQLEKNAKSANVSLVTLVISYQCVQFRSQVLFCAFTTNLFLEVVNTLF